MSFDVSPRLWELLTLSPDAGRGKAAKDAEDVSTLCIMPECGFEFGILGRADRPRSADRKPRTSYIQSADQGWSALPVGDRSYGVRRRRPRDRPSYRANMI